MGSFFFERLANTCHNFLFQNNIVLSYLKNNRGLSDNTIRAYRIGAFPKDLRFLTNELSWKELFQNGIIWNAEKSPFKHYSVVIPISNINGTPIAIGARTLFSDDKREKLGIPKYYNSVYSKASYLFGLDKAINAIRKFDQVFVVEGYFDVLTAHQHNIKNVVATCGTVFSLKQLILLSRYTRNITLLFDNDKPGRLNSDRVKKKFSHINYDGINLSYKFTPEEYKDLDEFLSKSNDISSLGLERMIEDDIII